MFATGDKVEVIADDYAILGVMRGYSGSVVQQFPSFPLPYCAVDFGGGMYVSVYNHHLTFSAVAPKIQVNVHSYAQESTQQTTDNKQKFIDKDAMWEAIVATSKGQ